MPCDENPCQNGAVCLLEDDRPVCYCVPDYHGALCELKYDDCESKFARCDNGGTCIDGVNSFTCSCPSNYGGPMCEYNFSSTTAAVEVEDTSETSPVKTTTVASPRESTLLVDISAPLSSTSATNFAASSTSPRTSSSPYMREYTVMEKTTAISEFESSPSASSDDNVFLTEVPSTSSTSREVIRDGLITSEPVTMSSVTTESYVTDTASVEAYLPTGRSIHDEEVTKEPDDRMTKTISERTDEDVTRVTQQATSR